MDLETVRLSLRRNSPRRISETNVDRAAVAVILVDSGVESPDLLLIKRAERKDDPWSGQMALPGGRRESDNEALVDTACRETFEEAGIVLLSENVVGELDDIRPQGPNLPRIVVRPFVFLLKATPRVITNEEVDLHLWVKLSELPKVACAATVSVDGVALSMPAFCIGPHVVWGLTERILKSFIELCQ